MEILEDYYTRTDLAEALGVSERTIARYERLPDGLPSLTLGGRKLYPIEAVKHWIAKRIEYPNPRRDRGNIAYKGGRQHG